MLVSRGHSRRRARGFTLIELVTAITVMAVLAGLALPTFRGFVANQRIRNASFDLMAALTLVRSEAITRGGNVSITKKAGTRWDEGWTVVDAADAKVQVQDGRNNISITDSLDRDTITYGKDGRIVTASTKFTIAPSAEVAGVSSRCVAIGLSGVPSSSVGAC